ncbi:iron(III) ABC transporter periplasmic iron-binding protein CeuE [Helicobacter fennelliae]|uniref:Iron(III) ABC transporter periplasmic iron-binding protein CeuE n=1 Tax=Helicobacter fennelliae TaxID=215 RepID=A0A2X3DY48_9HELI|nr:ABC transporter substrate-binding protein [Helicobacter fennelliae]SQC36202.1 iron(III) ABC transporter periplasmic iron-binding protein CeuE [Helicobacter fennelliae]
MIAFYPQSIYELFATLYRIALVFDKQEMYLKKQDKAFEMIELITSRTKSLPHKKRAIYIWDKLTSISGRVGMVGDMLEIAGLDSMGKDMRVDSYQTNVESILRFDPEVIFIWGGSSLNEATLYANPQLKTLPPYKTKKSINCLFGITGDRELCKPHFLSLHWHILRFLTSKKCATQIQDLNLMWFGLKEFPATIPLLDEPQ